MLEAYLEALDLAYYEATFAFDGLADNHVWLRPSEKLLSAGELAGHIAYWEAVKFAGEGEDLSKCLVRSSLIDARFRYHPNTLATGPADFQLLMSASQVCSELLRVHQESMAQFKALNRKLTDHSTGLPYNATYGELLKYASFHVAYHTGQIYTVRHLLGEQPPDN